MPKRWKSWCKFLFLTFKKILCNHHMKGWSLQHTNIENMIWKFVGPIFGNYQTYIEKYSLIRFLTNSSDSLNLTAPTRMWVFGMSIVNDWKEGISIRRIRICKESNCQRLETIRMAMSDRLIFLLIDSYNPHVVESKTNWNFPVL